MISLTTLGTSRVERLVQGRLTAGTDGPGFVDITQTVRAFVRQNLLTDGLLNAWMMHTTASLTVQENADRNVQTDLLDALDRHAPRDRPYRHATEGADDMPGHIRAMLTSTSVTLAVCGGRLALGTWQALYLIEHRDGPHERQIHLAFAGA